MLKFPFVHDPCTLGFFCSRSLDLVFFINLLFIDQKKKKKEGSQAKEEGTYSYASERELSSGKVPRETPLAVDLDVVCVKGDFSTGEKV